MKAGDLLIWNTRAIQEVVLETRIHQGELQWRGKAEGTSLDPDRWWNFDDWKNDFKIDETHRAKTLLDKYEDNS